MDLEAAMRRLARRRPIFCSEADFQHELAHELRLIDPQLRLRLEYPLGPGLRGAVDILASGTPGYAIELKYLCRSLRTTVDDEVVLLRHQGAHDIRRYDVCKDLQRMEQYSQRTGCGAAIVVLTNDPAYWNARRRVDTIDADFDLAETRALCGTLRWGTDAGAGTTRGRQAPIEIRGDYRLAWRDYSDLAAPGGRFRYLLVPVALPRGAERA